MQILFLEIIIDSIKSVEDKSVRDQLVQLFLVADGASVF